MPSPADLALPLTEDDWETLEEFLDQPGGPDLDTAVGFLTAVVTAPSHIPPSAWIPMVLGDRELQGQDDPALGLVLRMFNTISKTTSDGRVFHPDADQVEEIERWCKGYVMGIDLDDQWIDDVDALKPIFPFFVLAGEHKLNEPGDDAPVADEEAWKQKARKDLGGLAFEAFELLAAKRRVLPAAPGDRVRESPKVGRNAPCPCRSGKKYKKCCGR